jgi:RHS repeat-associated protein
LATDETDTVVWRWNSNAFGKGGIDKDPDGDGKKHNLRLRFPGQYADTESGLYYNWNRYYHPKLGRYITSDPIGLRGGVNTYLYAEANPNSYFDNDGLASGVAPGVRKRRDRLENIGDLLDTAACAWWPASCLIVCVRWRCSITDECGITRVWYVGEDSLPGMFSPGYKPENDKNCECTRTTINNS